MPRAAPNFFISLESKRRGSIKLTKIIRAARGACGRDGRPQGFNVSVVGVFDDYPIPTMRRYVH